MSQYPEVTEFAALLLQPITQEEGVLLSLVVDAVQQEINASLRSDVDPADCAETLSLAAVLLSVSAMRQLRDADISDFTAGTLKVSLRSDHSAYAETARRLLAPWCANGVAFRGVSG